MELWQAGVMGIVEGITEFLPVSSTAHLVILSRVLHIEPSQFLTTFEIVIQLGALLALVPIALRIVWKEFSLIGKAIVAFIPVAIIGYFFYDTIAGLLSGSLLPIGLALVIGGVFILLIEVWYERRGQHLQHLRYGIVDRESAMVSWRDSVLIGCVQILALIPGVSRSGATVMGGLLSGMSRRAVVAFSFLLAFPVLIGASGLSLMKTNFAFSEMEWITLLVGFCAAWGTAWLSASALMRYIEKHSFKPFGWYRVILGASILICVAIGILW